MQSYPRTDIANPTKSNVLFPLTVNWVRFVFLYSVPFCLPMHDRLLYCSLSLLM